ncbi:MAG: TMEM165/GDT1 family protein [Nanoarchaeota archaeon]|nr:TMEM165/GDT1 family protein [Nanoarchaeota archaeon]
MALVSEIADKTQLVILGLALKYKSLLLGIVFK